jgi:hypothetical protein
VLDISCVYKCENVLIFQHSVISGAFNYVQEHIRTSYYISVSLVTKCSALYETHSIFSNLHRNKN